MTREEAIEMIRDDVKKHHDYLSSQYRKCLKMAIEALEQEPCEDAISRREAITLPVMPKEHREYQTYNLDDVYEQGWFDLQKCIEELPSAQPDEKRTKERTKTHACDLISRQAAIDACLKLSEARRKWDTAEGRAEMRGIDAVMCAIHDLPSAQSDLETKILAAGYEGKELRIYIGGRLFGVRELAQ